MIPKEKIQAVRNQDMASVLERLGLNENRYGMFPAVWRGEKIASVKILASGNYPIWYDHGGVDVVKGSNIDLVMLVLGCKFQEAVYWLDGQTYSEASTPAAAAYHPPTPPTPKETGWEILAERQLSKTSRQRFQKERGIPNGYLDFAGIMQYQIKSLKSGKTFWIPGVQNRAGGHELFMTNPGGFKTSSSPKDISTSGSGQVVIIAESVIDGLSAMVISKTKPDSNAIRLISLNSVQLIDRAIDALHHGDIIIDAIDRDQPGQRASEKLKSLYGYYRLPYAGKDPNEALRAST